MGDAPSANMGSMPPLRQNHPTTQSQQPHQQATPYVPAVVVSRRVSFAPETSTSTGASSYYSDAVRRSASGDRQSQGQSTERAVHLLLFHKTSTGKAAPKADTGEDQKDPSQSVTPLSRWYQRTLQSN